MVPDRQNLPEPATQIWARFHSEKNNVIRFYLFIDCFEVALQFSVAIMVAAIRRDLQESNRSKVLAQISDPLRGADLGKFGNVLAICIKALEMSWSVRMGALEEAVREGKPVRDS